MDDMERNEELTVHHFQSLAASRGGEWATLDWGSPKSQQLRFKVLAEVGLLDGASVLDVGCGHGDFIDWCRDNGLRIDYTGVDITPPMLEVAKRKHPESRFELCSILKTNPPKLQYDYVIASGIFYKATVDSYTYLDAMARRMFSLCRRATAFNLLSARTPASGQDEFRAEPAHAVEIAQAISLRFSLRHDYHPGDFSIYLHKDAQ